MKIATKKALFKEHINQLNITTEDQKKAIEDLINSEETHGKDLHRAIKITQIDFCEVGEWERFFETQELSDILRTIERNTILYKKNLEPFNLEILIGAEKALMKLKAKQNKAATAA